MDAPVPLPIPMTSSLLIGSDGRVQGHTLTSGLMYNCPDDDEYFIRIEAYGKPLTGIGLLCSKQNATKLILRNGTDELKKAVWNSKVGFGDIKGGTVDSQFYVTTAIVATNVTECRIGSMYFNVTEGFNYLGFAGQKSCNIEPPAKKIPPISHPIRSHIYNNSAFHTMDIIWMYLIVIVFLLT